MVRQVEQPSRANTPTVHRPAYEIKQQSEANKSDDGYVGDRSLSGLRHGRGIMNYPNGCRYAGSFFNDKRQGFGKVWYPNGIGIYTGDWHDNKRHGTGSMIFANGDTYEGQWRVDEPNGVGTLFMKSTGELYNGGFVNRQKDGTGLYKWPTGDVYRGEYKKDVRHGAGRMVFANGDIEKRVYFQGILMSGP